MLRKHLLANPLLLLALLLAPFTARAQSGSISGTITNAENNEPVIGVSVAVKGTSRGAVTDPDGSFFISAVPAGEQTIVASSVGFEPQERTITVPDGGIVNENFTLGSSSKALEEIVVTGIRRSQITAINAKRTALNTKEVLSTNDIGRLPDINVAEATQRVAGVSIETDKGEGRFVQIRGIQPALNNVTLNGTNLPSTSGSRATALDLMPVESISSIEVSKVMTPDMEGNALGGTVNINTISAFDRADPFLIISADGLIQEQQAEYGDQKFPFRVAATAGKKFFDNKLGIVGSANFFRRDFSISVVDPDEWIYISETGTPPAYFVPNEIEIQIEDNERDRAGLTLDLDFRPTDFSSIYFRGLYTRTAERTLNSEAELTIDDGELTNQTPTTGNWSLGSSELDMSGDDETENMYSFTLGGKNRWGNFFAEAYATYTRADQFNDNTDGTYENPEDTEPQFSNSYDVDPFFFVITPDNPEIATDPDVHLLRSLNLNTSDVLQESIEASVDLRYDFNLGAVTSNFKFGGRYRDREIEVDRERDEYALDGGVGNGDITAEDPYRLSENDIYLPPFEPVQGGTEALVHGDAERFIDFFGNPDNLDPRKIVFRPEDSRWEGVENDLRNSERVIAGYGMFTFDFGGLNLIAGARVENTETSSTRFISSLDDGAEIYTFTQDTDVNSYTNFLPAIVARYDVTNNLVARASWTNTIGRPDYRNLSQTTEIEFEETSTEEVYEGQVEEANPDLKPFLSSNLDASLEYYIPNGGLIAVGGFFKDIENQILTEEFRFNDTTYQGRFYEIIEFERDVNADEASLYGLELTYDHAFTFLPGFFGGFGVTTNATFIGSEVTVRGREDDNLPLLRQPSTLYNIIPYFQKYGVEVRLAVSYRSDFLRSPQLPGGVEDEVALGARVSDFDRYETERTTVDITAAYTLPSRKAKILFQARNITNAPEARYQGNSSRLDRHVLVGRTYFLGFSLNL